MSRISGRPAISTEHVYGLSLRVARWREGAPGTPLLFLNGIGADIAAAAPLLAQVDGREVWTLDMPGVGGSPDALLPYAAPTIAAEVMEIADRLGHKVIDVAGVGYLVHCSAKTLNALGAAGDACTLYTALQVSETTPPPPSAAP